MEFTYQARCYCNSVSTRFDQAPILIVNCHCESCRLRSGSAYVTYAVFPKKACHIDHGEELLTTYAIEEIGVKIFCRHCGSPLFNEINRFQGVMMVYIGALNKQAVLAPTINIHCENKLPWIDHLAEMKNFQQWHV